MRVWSHSFSALLTKYPYVVYSLVYILSYSNNYTQGKTRFNCLNYFVDYAWLKTISSVRFLLCVMSSLLMLLTYVCCVFIESFSLWSLVWATVPAILFPDRPHPYHNIMCIKAGLVQFQCQTPHCNNLLLVISFVLSLFSGCV